MPPADYHKNGMPPQKQHSFCARENFAEKQAGERG
jgi:hypothetical protein